MENLDSFRSKINYSAILTTGRTGSDYLHACLDNVPGILTFSGSVFFYNFCDNLKKNFKDYKPIEMLELFIEKNKYLFLRDDIENKEININLQIFKKNFLNVFDKSDFNKKNFLVGLYVAYHLTLNRKIENILTMVHHSHSVPETKRFLEDFKTAKLLTTIRDPRATLKSGIVNWIKYDKKKQNEEHFYLYIKRIREDFKFSQKINKKFYIKLEEANNIDLKKNLTKFLEINFHENILKATFAGKTWSGDKLSSFRSEDGKYNENVKKNDWENFFTYFDKKILNLIYNSYSSFGYSFKKLTFLSFVMFFFTIPFPMSFERIFFKPKYYFNKDILIKYKFLNFYFYFKRILYFYLILLETIKDKINEKTH